MNIDFVPTASVSTLTANGPEKPAIKLLYSKREAAQLLSIGTRSLDYLIQDGQISVRRIGRRVLISHADLVQFARRDHGSTGRPRRGQTHGRKQ